MSELDLRVHWSMYVPRTLAKTGVGGYGPGSLPHFLAAFAEAGEGEVLDISANIRPYTLLAQAFSDRVVRRFEPTPELADIAESCAAANGLDYLVERIALGAGEGTAKLYCRIPRTARTRLTRDSVRTRTSSTYHSSGSTATSVALERRRPSSKSTRRPRSRTFSGVARKQWPNTGRGSSARCYTEEGKTAWLRRWPTGTTPHPASTLPVRWNLVRRSSAISR